MLQRSVSARFVNEIAWWRLESPGADYDDGMLGAVLRPGKCRFRDDREYFARQALLLQQVAPSKWQVALTGERELLARWGKPRLGVPDRPFPSLAQQEDAAIACIRAGQESRESAMPPVLASRLLVERITASMRAESARFINGGCREPWPQRTLARMRRSSPTRYAMVPIAPEWLRMPEAPAAGKRTSTPDRYPRFAGYFGVERTLTLKITTDLDGHFKHAVVVDRDITVPGVSGRPVAFEIVLDEASIARAAAATYPKRDPSVFKGGLVNNTQKITWRLE